MFPKIHVLKWPNKEETIRALSWFVAKEWDFWWHSHPLWCWRRHLCRGVWGHATPEDFEKLYVAKTCFSLFWARKWPFESNYLVPRFFFKVTPDLRGCPQGKNLYAHHFKGKHGKLYIIAKLNRCRFRKKNINFAKENCKQPRKWPCVIQLN